MKPTFFQGNRQALLRSVGTGALIILAGYKEMQRSGDTTFVFEQESNFYYLSGINMPGWRLIIDGKRHKSYLVSPHVSEAKEIFDGSMTSEQALEISGCDEVISYDAADSLIMRLKTEHPIVYTVDESRNLAKYYVDMVFNPAQKELGSYLRNRFSDVRSCEREVHQLRMIKQPEEIECIKKAIKLSIDGFETLKQERQSYKYEYEAEARLSYDFRRKGATGHAYAPIVGDHHNACTLHYVANNDRLKPKSLLLIDAGASYLHYAADITRTYSIGQPTARQKAVYAGVLSVQKACIKAVRPGTTIEAIHRLAEEETARVLKDLGLYKTDESVSQYFPHAIGHGLGLDVHDPLGAREELKPGMVLTIEPGIYIPEESIGVRIEDDILVTEDGCINLSRGLSTDLA
jgi:Xaa-Pro aminopeptidase